MYLINNVYHCFKMCCKIQEASQHTRSRRSMQLLQFFFSKINTEEILRKILRLETSEACRDTDIPTNIKENADIFADIFFASFIDSVKKSNFPFFLKNANITSVYKKVAEILKITTYHSAYFQICLKYLRDVFFRQLYSFMLEFLSKYQCSFRKGCRTQHHLLAILEKQKSAFDKGKSFGALLTDLSKAFDCLSHNVLLANFHAYAFSIVALRLIYSYLTSRKQRTKVNFVIRHTEQQTLLMKLLIHQNMTLCCSNGSLTTK